MLREHSLITTNIQKFLDVGISAFSFIAAYFIKRHVLPEGLSNLSNDPNYYIVLLAIIITWYIAFNWMGMYISYRQSQFYQFFVKIIKSVLLGMVLLNIALYIAKRYLVSKSSQNAVNIIMKNVMDFSIGSLAFFLVGFGGRGGL